MNTYNNLNFSLISAEQFCGYDTLQVYLKKFHLTSNSQLRNKTILKNNFFIRYSQQYSLISIKTNVSLFNRFNIGLGNLYSGTQHSLNYCIEILLTTLRTLGVTVDIDDLFVSKVDFNINIITPDEPSLYLEYFSPICRYKMDESYCGTVYLIPRSSPKIKNVYLKFYNKTVQMKQAYDLSIPIFLLRFEITLKNKRRFKQIGKILNCHADNFIKVQNLCSDYSFYKLKIFLLSKVNESLPLNHILKPSITFLDKSLIKLLMKTCSVNEIEFLRSYNSSNPFKDIWTLNRKSDDTYCRKKKKLNKLLKKLSLVGNEQYFDARYSFLKQQVEKLLLESLLNSANNSNPIVEEQLSIIRPDTYFLLLILYGQILFSPNKYLDTT